MTSQSSLADAEYITDVLNIYPQENSADNAETDVAGQARPQLPGARISQAKTKSTLLSRLTRDFDLLIYCELSALYYMDCSIINFALRAMVQLIFFTPKPSSFPVRNQPFIGAIFLSNLICIILHIIAPNPTGGEAARGYLRGGIFIDFVGQSGPISKFQLLSIDFLIILLQIIMMGVVLEQEKTTGVFQPRPGSTATRAQDQNSEELGILRSDQHEPGQSSEAQINGAIPSTAEISGIEENDHDRQDAELRPSLSGETSFSPDSNFHPCDSFRSGESLVVDINIGSLVYDQWFNRPSAELEPSSTAALGSAREPASAFVTRRLGFQMLNSLS
ncbi:hypothetical protein FQN57_001017 [Myotisia sp. PD_48]|nr:hypothetical protein FQN57_001017 [Myotisia sp. PD_48]